MLDQLQTDWIDCLVVHDLDDPVKNTRQLLLAQSWQKKGTVRQLGSWAPSLQKIQSWAETPFQFVVQPFNISNYRQSAPILQAAKSKGCRTLACSPFVRGWELERLVAATHQQSSLSLADGDLRKVLSDLLLRFALFGDSVDMLIVAIRDFNWIEANLASVERRNDCSRRTGLAVSFMFEGSGIMEWLLIGQSGLVLLLVAYIRSAGDEPQCAASIYSKIFPSDWPH